MDSENTESVVKIGIDCTEPHMEFHVISHFANCEEVTVFPTLVVGSVKNPGPGTNVGYDSSPENSVHPY